MIIGINSLPYAAVYKLLGPLMLKSRVWSCETLAAGVGHMAKQLVDCKLEAGGIQDELDVP